MLLPPPPVKKRENSVVDKDQIDSNTVDKADIHTGDFAYFLREILEENVSLFYLPLNYFSFVFFRLHYFPFFVLFFLFSFKKKVVTIRYNCMILSKMTSP